MSAKSTTPVAKFRLGRIVATPNALAQLTQTDILTAIQRHQAGDWGEVTTDDHQENELSLQRGFRLLSVYRSASGIKFWIITEADRSVTTVLLPEDYSKHHDSSPPGGVIFHGKLWSGCRILVLLFLPLSPNYKWPSSLRRE